MQNQPYNRVSKLNIKKNNYQFQKPIHKPLPLSQSYCTVINSQYKIHDVSQNNGEIMNFPTFWSVWIHKNSSSDWSLDSYHKIMTIHNVADLFGFLNNFDKINYMEYQFFIMKNSITPVWEDPENKYGGAASIIIRISDPNLLKIWEDICVMTINEQIYDKADEITGISFNLKNDLTVIKIWNKNMNDDISKKLPECFISKYKLYSVAYRKNRAVN
jgi:hypothetical protein